MRGGHCLAGLVGRLRPLIPDCLGIGLSGPGQAGCWLVGKMGYRAWELSGLSVEWDNTDNREMRRERLNNL